MNVLAKPRLYNIGMKLPKLINTPLKVCFLKT